jgi:hypothetical protein
VSFVPSQTVPGLTPFAFFSSYVKDVARAASTNYVYFEDIVPTNLATRASAANAFFYLLAMSTRDVLRPWVLRQRELFELDTL